MTASQSWAIFYKSLSPIYNWEKPTGGGLLLAECPHCHHKQTRDTYIDFWQLFVTLEQSYIVMALAQCPKCHSYLKYIS